MQRLNVFGSSVALLATCSLASAQQEVVTLSGVNAGEQFGWSIAFVGDVDCDMHADIAVGSPGDNSSTGKVTVFSGATLQPFYVWTGAATGDRYGTALANAGDVDLDGIDDVIVGAPAGLPYLGFPSTHCYVELRSGRNGAVLYTLANPGVPRGFGAAVTGGGDIDGDSVPDVIVGAPEGPGGYGAAYVFSGASGALLRTHVPPVQPQPYLNGPTLGYSVAFLGDANGDGRAEYALGAPGMFSNESNNYVQLCDGATGDSLWRAQIYDDYEEFGWSLATVGDQNGDGVVDLAAGARQHGSFSGLGWGKVRVLDGANGAILGSYGQGVGAQPAAVMGWSVAAVGDVNGDGKTDFAGGAPGGDPYPTGFSIARATRVWSIQGPGALLTLPPYDAADAFGFALASGDANGDGLRDLLVGEPLDDDFGDASGSVHVFTFVRSTTTYCVAQVNSQGCTPAIGSVGAPSASSFLGFDVTASNILNNASGILFYGSAPNNSPHLGGTLCVRQPVHRTPVQSSGGNTGAPDCSGTFAFDFNAWIQSGADPALGAGAEVFAQYWSRDAAAFFSTTNLTDALAFFVGP
jgi:hypothetical protein